MSVSCRPTGPAWMMAILALTVVAPFIKSHAQTPASLTDLTVPAVCGVTPTTPPEPRRGEPHFPSYLSDNFAQLKLAVPILKSLKYEAHSPTPDQPDESDEILAQTGAGIAAMLPRIPNLIAREELSQAAIALPYIVSDAQQQSGGGIGSRRGPAPSFNETSRTLEGDDLYKVIRNTLDSPKDRVVFTFRVQSTPDETYGAILSESRINGQNESISMSATDAGHPRSVGFSSSWLMFAPQSLKEFRFRYLGHQKLDKRETVVIAYVQIPDRVTLPPRIGFREGFCPYYIQGLVWIDPAIFQIVRMQSDLLAPLPYNQTTRLRSEMRFIEVHIPERNLNIWMPGNVEISWQNKNQLGAELHKYSNYRLFGATSRIVLDPE